MIKGKMIAAGTMRLDDEEVTGCFIECTVAELRDNRPDIFQEVEIRAVQHATSESTPLNSDKVCDRDCKCFNTCPLVRHGYACAVVFKMWRIH